MAMVKCPNCGNKFIGTEREGYFNICGECGHEFDGDDLAFARICKIVWKCIQFTVYSLLVGITGWFFMVASFKREEKKLGIFYATMAAIGLVGSISFLIAYAMKMGTGDILYDLGQLAVLGVGTATLITRFVTKKKYKATAEAQQAEAEHKAEVDGIVAEFKKTLKTKFVKWKVEGLDTTGIDEKWEAYCEELDKDDINPYDDLETWLKPFKKRIQEGK